MNCQAVQNQILALPEPRELTPALRAHVLACAACQAWARQAARLEGLLEQLPVPSAPGEKKEMLLGELMAADPVIRPMATPATRPGFGLVAIRFLSRNAVSVGGLAAAVLVGIYALWPTPQNPVAGAPTQKDPFLESVVARNVAMARADTPAKKLEVLNGMADDLASGTRGMARLASGAELKQMARRYEKVVAEGIVPQTRNLPTEMPTADKARLLDGLAKKLEAEADEVEKVARESPPDAQPALKQMADAARNGEKLLRAAAHGSK